jgi:Rho-binding antiterminator
MIHSYEPISCSLHDYLEIACIYQYRICLALDSDEIVVGTAKNVETDSNKAEHLVLQTDDDIARIRLDRILTLKPETKGARFGKVHFRST